MKRKKTNFLDKKLDLKKSVEIFKKNWSVFLWSILFLAFFVLITQVSQKNVRLSDTISALQFVLDLGKNEYGSIICSGGHLEILQGQGTNMRVACVANAAPTPTPTPPPSLPPTLPPSNNQTPNFQPFGSAHFTRADYAFAVDGAGSSIDTYAFWEALDPTQSLMFVSSKDSPLVEVWHYPFKQGNELTPLESSCFNENTNGLVVDQTTDELFVALRNNGRICVFSIPELVLLRTLETDVRSNEPKLSMLSADNEEFRLYVTDDSRVHILDPLTGTSFPGSPFNTPSSTVGTVWADTYHQQLFISSELGTEGIHIADYDGNHRQSFGAEHFSGDAEGLYVYTCPSDGTSDNGEGLIFASDMSSTDQFEVFNRRTLEHLGHITVEGIGNVDSISMFQQNSPEYPMGFFVGMRGGEETIAVGFDTIFAATGLSCNSVFDP